MTSTTPQRGGDVNVERYRILQGARAHGCICNPDITFEQDKENPKLRYAHIAHDDWCPFIAAMPNKTEVRFYK